MKTLTLETDRLRIYPATDAQMEQTIQAESDPEMKKAYTEMLDGCRAHPAQRIWYVIWFIARKEAPEAPIGDLCFKGLGNDGMVELGYGIAPAYQNHGYMTEAARAMTQWAAGQPGVTRVEAETEPGNAASQRVLTKAGYLPSGQLGEEGPRWVYRSSGELLDIVDGFGEPTGQTVERNTAHALGIPHRTSHVWLLRHREGSLQVLLQKRSLTKSTCPGRYDISSAGHIPAGCGFEESALRELWEELGVKETADHLIYCGSKTDIWDEDEPIPFHDRQFTRVYLLWCDLDEADFRLQQEEVDSVLWMDLDACIQAVEQNTIYNCMYPEELKLVRAKAQEG